METASRSQVIIGTTVLGVLVGGFILWMIVAAGTNFARNARQMTPKRILVGLGVFAGAFLVAFIVLGILMPDVRQAVKYALILAGVFVLWCLCFGEPS
ncbi:hypothetical protein [Embleya sp. NPDC020630]|uniref:hypothetical protein n=1 Tax=Embleya sp. NPDC020630 TaxID=3363979 RepID=UPI0037B2FACB